ncbi:hypothetical protein TGME49_266400 [Toxoplasma gondii ME49]|uniref:Nucleolar protein 9 n=2 Tax=Toxoplasma gondii TaxID=5811 RepID=S8EZ45_TOXGM|nr:hypothetical protein TGME49_266400 [Toxoplasma gondii ME49]EPT27662.1 hypothetical protein TGME49_266400 [Toxoplasma gondii ME49]KYF45509.1 putative nucleolar protein 9 [Toxoplasma gondii ARI]|eukprot:XP_002368729.1 hypothetical protein TGME49_266400 [Toxoplasma gondii ME49]
MAKGKRRGGRRHKRTTASAADASDEGELPEGSEGEVEDQGEDAVSLSGRAPATCSARKPEKATKRRRDEDSESPAAVHEDALVDPEASPVVPSDGGYPKVDKQKSKGKRSVDGYVEYLTHVKDVIDQRAFKSDEEWQTFVAATAEEVGSKTPLVLTDQRCSKVVEKILGLLAGFLSSSGASRREQQKQNIHAFLLLLRKLSGSAGQLAVHANGSHVLQTLFGALPCVLDAERRLREEGDEEAAQSVEDLTLYSLHAIESEQGGWISLMTHSCGSHVFRAVVRAAAGIYSLPSVDELGRRKPRKRRQETAETLPDTSLSGDGAGGSNGTRGTGAQRFPSPPSLQALLQRIAKSVAAAVSANPYSLLFDVYASPALQLLLHVTASAPQFEKAKTRLLAAIFRLDSPEATRRSEMMQLADALVDSPTGSRALEVAALMLAPEPFELFFSSWLLKRVNHLAQGRFGNFMLQKLLTSTLLQPAHVRQLVGAVDFSACVAARTPAVLWRLSEACRRVRTSQADFAKRLFAAFDLHNPKNLPFAWFSLLALARPEGLSPSLCFFAQQEKAGDEGEQKPHTLRHLSDMVTPTGVSIVLSLLRFPPAAIQPLVGGFKKFVKILKRTSVSVRQWRGKDCPPLWDERPALLSLATDAQGSRLLEGLVKAAASASHSSGRGEKESESSRNVLFPPQAVQQLLKAFCGNYAQAALHPTGGFVVTTFYDAATVDIKRRIVQELLEVEEELREKNYAAYVNCEIHTFKRNEEGWATRQEKKSKTRELFKDLLAEEGDQAEDVVEAEKTEKHAAHEAARALLERDAVAQQLLGVDEKKKSKKTVEKRKKKQAPESDSDGDVFEESSTSRKEAQEAVDTIFSEAAKEQKGKRRRTKTEQTELADQDADGASAADSSSGTSKKRKGEKGEAAPQDKTLEAAFFFIEGTRSDLSKRQVAKRRKLEAAKLAAAGAPVDVR